MRLNSLPNQSSIYTEYFTVSWFKIIDEISSDLADSYIELLQSFFETNNLRYAVKRNRTILEISFNPAFIASERFLTVKNKHCNNKHLKALYDDFENSFGGLIRNHNLTQIKNTLGDSSNLVEALANKSVNKTGKTLSSILRNDLLTNQFPHEEAKGILQKLYSFFSDYPGIRHGGNAASAKRDLSERDAFLFSSLSILFADYLSKCECPICGSEMSIVDELHGKIWQCNLAPACHGSKPCQLTSTN